MDIPVPVPIFKAHLILDCDGDLGRATISGGQTMKYLCKYISKHLINVGVQETLLQFKKTQGLLDSPTKQCKPC